MSPWGKQSPKRIASGKPCSYQNPGSPSPRVRQPGRGLVHSASRPHSRTPHCRSQPESAAPCGLGPRRSGGTCTLPPVPSRSVQGRWVLCFLCCHRGHLRVQLGPAHLSDTKHRPVSGLGTRKSGRQGDCLMTVVSERLGPETYSAGGTLTSRAAWRCGGTCPTSARLPAVTSVRNTSVGPGIAHPHGTCFPH